MFQRLYTLVETAQILNMSKYSLYRLTKNKKIKYIRIGRKKLFSEDIIKEYIESNTIEKI